MWESARDKPWSDCLRLYLLIQKDEAALGMRRPQSRGSVLPLQQEQDERSFIAGRALSELRRYQPDEFSGALQFSNTVTALADAMYPHRESGPTHQDIPQHMLAISCRELCLAGQTSAWTDCSKVALDPIEPVARLAFGTSELVGVLGLRQTDHDGGSPQLKDRDVGGGLSLLLGLRLLTIACGSRHAAWADPLRPFLQLGCAAELYVVVEWCLLGLALGHLLLSLLHCLSML